MQPTLWHGAGRAHNASVLGLAARKVFLSIAVTCNLVGSYPTFSALPVPTCAGHRRFKSL